MNIALWLILLSVSGVVVLCKHRTAANKCSQPWGCGRQRAMHTSSTTQSSKLRSHRKPSSLNMKSFGRVSHHQRPKLSYRARSMGKNASNLKPTLIAVLSLADNIIKALILKERLIGIHIKEYMDSITKALTRISDFILMWTGETPNILDFIDGVTFALDDLTTSSPEILDDFFLLRDLQSNQSLGNETIIKSTRLRFNYKRKGAKNIPNYLRPPKSSKKRRVYAKLEDFHWWRPIVKFKEYLKYADLWMKFLEELNLKLETAETQLRRNELRMDFEFMESRIQPKLENITDLFVKICRNFDLPSLRNRIPELIETVNENRMKYLSDIIRINILTNRDCVEKNNIAYAVAPYLTVASAGKCIRSLWTNNSQINAVALVGVVRLVFAEIVQVDYFRDSRLEFGKGFHFIFISPEWVPLVSDEPRFRRFMNIQGRDGAGPTSVSYTEGEAGLPGEEGARFYGFGIHVQGAGVRIYMDGGGGGKGQDGGTKPCPVVGCFEDEQKVKDCCIKLARFIYPGVNGGKPGLGAAPGEYRLFLFDNKTLDKFTFIQNVGPNGSPGNGHDFYRIGDGFVANEDTLKKCEIPYVKDEGYCPKRTPVLYFPFTTEKQDWFRGKDGASDAPQKTPQKVSFGPEKSVPAILMHKLWSLRYSHLFNTRRLRAFASKTDMDVDFQSLLTTTDLIEEFNNLEKEAQAGYLDPEVLKLSYQSIASRAQQRAKNYTGENPEDNLKVLSFLSSAARSKLLATTNPYEPVLVVDMVNFLTAEKTRINRLKEEVEEELQYQHITSAVASYNQMIQDHFKEADYLINNTINPEFDEIEMKMTQLAQALLDKIKQLKEDEDNNRKELEEYRAKLQSHQTGNLISNMLKLGGNLLSLLHPAAGAIAVGVDLGNGIFNPMPGDPGVKPVPVPEAVNSNSMRSALSFRKSTDYNMKGFTRQLKAVKMTVESESQYFPNTLRIIGSMSSARFPRVGDDVDPPMDEFPPADLVLSFKLLMTTQNTIREVKLNITAAIKLDLDNAKNQSSTRISNETIERLETAASVATTVAEGAASTYNQWNQDQDNIDEVTKAIKESEKRSMAYQRHIDRIENELLPQIDSMFKGLSDVRQDLADLSSVGLIVVRHTMQKTIRDAQLDFKKEFVEGTGLEDYFERALQSALDAMETLINIYERLDAYKEQGKLANFTAEVALNPKYYLEKLKDPNMQAKYDELRYTLQGEILLKRQSLVEGAFRMWKFPMVDPVLCDFKNLSSTVLNFSTTENVFKFLNDMDKRVDDLLEFVRITQSSITPGDPYIIITEFSRKPRSFPFYKWENATTSGFIATMLKGRQTYLRSKETPGVPICEAIKFRRVSLSFGSSNGDQALEDEMASVLKDYTVTLIHTGNSFYLFANESFAINSEKVELTFSFELNSEGVPVLRNGVYDKLLKGDLTLSPYTTWLITVKPRPPQDGFEPLKKFIGKVDLYLEGNGTCVSKSFATEGKYVSPTCEDF